MSLELLIAWRCHVDMSQVVAKFRIIFAHGSALIQRNPMVTQQMPWICVLKMLLGRCRLEAKFAGSIHKTHSLHALSCFGCGVVLHQCPLVVCLHERRFKDVWCNVHAVLECAASSMLHVLMLAACTLECASSTGLHVQHQLGACSRGHVSGGLLAAHCAIRFPTALVYLLFKHVPRCR